MPWPTPDFIYRSGLIYHLSIFLYPLRDPPKIRSVPLEVICVGIPRSATESLSRALLKLGYSDVSHGLTWWNSHAPYTAHLFFKLAMLRAQDRLPNPETLRGEYFDRILGTCAATTDIPSMWFAQELIAAYPDAQIILNRRKDVKAWKKSFRESVLPMMLAWDYYVWSWFEPVLFWGLALTYFSHGHVFFQHDFEKNAERRYIEHYDQIEAILKAKGRSYLNWSADQGWQPLCQFLDKEIPVEEFPSGNEAFQFIPTIMKTDTARMATAKRNATLLFGSLALATGGFIWSRLR